ncbi:MAG: NAD-dependent protein deacylase [Ruminococcaceae bacterium]|nr:NAD-dependent protein deacylase [Oscillospiraceae bacterium]
MQNYEQRIEKLKELINKSEKIVFFGGAGVSTESGVKDYRSEDGLYNTVKEFGVRPETILSHSFFIKNPDIFYDFYRKYFLQENIKPNAAHYALSDLEKMGNLSAVITQNIDGLHQLAGSEKVFEIHGTAKVHYCMGCGEKYDKYKILNEKVPICDKCGDIIRPKVTLYEEALDDEVTEGAIEAILNADLLIIGGTSLTVYPAAAFIRYYKGKNIVLINRSETPLDYKMSLIFHESIGRVLTDALK